MTTPQETLHIARAYSEAFNDRAFDRLPSIFDPDVVDESMSGQMVYTGVDAVSEALQGVVRSLPDARIEVVNAFATEDQAVLELKMVATNPESGRQQLLPICHVYRIRNGKVIHLTTYSDRTWR